MRALILGVRLLLEVALLVVLGWAGARLGGELGGVLAGVALALALPIVAAGAWGLVVAPRARLAVPSWLRVLVEVGLFAAAGAALAWLTRPALGVALVVADLAVIVSLAWTARGSGAGLSPHDVQQDGTGRRRGP